MIFSSSFGVFVYLCIELVWSALFLLSAVCQTGFPRESVSAYIRCTLSPMRHFVQEVLRHSREAKAGITRLGSHDGAEISQPLQILKLTFLTYASGEELK